MCDKKLSIIDYGLGNIKSLINAFRTFNVELLLTNNKDEILKSDGLILPGVGSFPNGMKKLHEHDLVSIIKNFSKSNKPILGICLGMQLLFEKGEEFESTQGIGLIKGVVKLINDKTKVKLPHVSWNEIFDETNKKWKNTILNGINNFEDFYFVHSYGAVQIHENLILSRTIYEEVNFCSTVKYNNIYGCQFHPEKSGTEGLRILKNFYDLC